MADQESLANAIGKLFSGAQRQFEEIAKTDLANAGVVYEAAILTGIAELASHQHPHGLVATLAEMYDFHVEHREDLLDPPPIFEPFLDGRNSHWEWLELTLNDRNLWEAVLADQNVDGEAFATWSQVGIETLEDDVATIFIEAVRRHVNERYPTDPLFQLVSGLAEARTWLTEYAGRPTSEWTLAPSLLVELMAIELQFSEEARFTLPMWEMASILDSHWIETMRTLQH